MKAGRGSSGDASVTSRVSAMVSSRWETAYRNDLISAVMNRIASSRRAATVLPVESAQKRIDFGSASLPASSRLIRLEEGSGRYSFDTTAASTTPPSSAL